MVAVTIDKPPNGKRRNQRKVRRTERGVKKKKWSLAGEKKTGKKKECSKSQGQTLRGGGGEAYRGSSKGVR